MVVLATLAPLLVVVSCWCLQAPVIAGNVTSGSGGNLTVWLVETSSFNISRLTVLPADVYGVYNVWTMYRIVNLWGKPPLAPTMYPVEVLGTTSFSKYVVMIDDYGGPALTVLPVEVFVKGSGSVGRLVAHVND